MGSRVVLAMSGGVDSSVAAHLLREDGHEVIGLFMRTGAFAQDEARRTKTCCSVTDARDAQAVADRLDIPFYALDFQADFARIMDEFADEYQSGRTPNPCVSCNIWLKFGKLWEYGKQVGADYVATGHYARIRADADGRPHVARGADAAKDQSYVLFGLPREVLPHVLLPVGDYPKAEIRGIAKGLGLPVHDKAESMEICFVPDDNYLGFVKGRRPGVDTSGPLVDEVGMSLGRHAGIEGFTVGQRRGLGVSLGSPRYVVQIEPATNTVTLGGRGALEASGLVASRFAWQGQEPVGPIACLAQIRARHKAVAATATPLGEGRVRVDFAVPQTSVTPGQVAVVYDEDLVLGGGWIDGASATESSSW